MRKTRYFVFEPFRLDVLDERLWERAKSVRLGHKALAVLECLVSQPGQPGHQGRAAGGGVAGHGGLRSGPDDGDAGVRRALGDQARVPRFIETVHGRGYRFIAPVTETSVPALPTISTTPETEAAALPTLRLPGMASPCDLVGREAEWARLRDWFATARAGRASDRIRRGRGWHREDRAGGGVRCRGGRAGEGAGRLRAMHPAIRRRRGVPANPRGSRAARA